MAEDQINVTFECLECGGTVLSLPDDHTDDSIASCKSCGQEFGTYGDIKAKARDMAAEEVSAMVKGAFKGLKGWKVE
tara:strand:+ start:341 stop:571 length:231 start_codon:yes stop_codon:yes gene_type:complete